MPISPDQDLLPNIKPGLQLLISANHILHHANIVDAFGHISIRHPLDSQTYIIASYDPRAQTSLNTAFEESKLVDAPQPKGYSERYIQGEIYAQIPQLTMHRAPEFRNLSPIHVRARASKPYFPHSGFLGCR
jgi:hypothetical protein